MVQMSPECKTVIFSNLILAKFYWNLELADLWHFPPRSPPLREPLPVFIRQKNCEHCPSYLTLPLAHLPWASSSQYLSSKKLQNLRVISFSLPSPALREPLPVSLFAAEHAICRPGNFNPQQNTPASDKIGQNTVGTKSGNFAEISILSGFLFNLFTNEVP